MILQGLACAKCFQLPHPSPSQPLKGGGDLVVNPAGHVSTKDVVHLRPEVTSVSNTCWEPRSLDSTQSDHICQQWGPTLILSKHGGRPWPGGSVGWGIITCTKRVQVRSPAGAVQEVTDQCFSLPLALEISKHVLR